MNIEKTFNYEKKDLTDYGFAAYFQKSGKVTIIITSIFVLCLLALIIITGTLGQLELLMAFLFFIITLITPAIIYFQMARTYKTSQFFQEEQHFVISDASIFGKSSIGESDIPWDKFHKFVVYKKCIAMYVSSRQAYIFPSRIFADDEIDEIKSFLINNGSTKSKTKIC